MTVQVALSRVAYDEIHRKLDALGLGRSCFMLDGLIDMSGIDIVRDEGCPEYKLASPGCPSHWLVQTEDMP